MARIAKQLTELIGGTPLLELSKFSASNNLQTPIVAKIESFNPGGSVKDRIALAMIEDAERKGLLKPGATIIEPTSGNTGVGLALVAAVKGYKLILTMPETMSVERRNLVKAYGAQVKLTPGKEGMKGAIEMAMQLRAAIPGAVILQQFENLANPERHYEVTGREIWADTSGEIDIFVAGVGTGGTVSGVGKYLKEKNPNVRIVAATNVQMQEAIKKGRFPRRPLLPTQHRRNTLASFARTQRRYTPALPQVRFGFCRKIQNACRKAQRRCCTSAHKLPLER